MRIFLLLITLSVAPTIYALEADGIKYIQEITKLNPSASNALHGYVLVHSISCDKQPTVEDIKVFHDSPAFKELMDASMTTPLGIASVSRVLEDSDYKLNCGGAL